MARQKIELDPAEMERYAASGLSDEEIATCLGISRTTLHNRRKENEQFEQAIKTGRLRSHLAVSNKLYDLCLNGNITAIIWYEKSRRGLTDKINVSPEELDAAINRELERIAAAS